jgi:glucosamine-6-phosphate deaminase
MHAHALAAITQACASGVNEETVMKKQQRHPHVGSIARSPTLTLEGPVPCCSTRVGGLHIFVYANESDMGLASALHLASQQRQLVATNGTTSIMLMAAPSAFPFYAAYIRLVESSPDLAAAVRRTHFFQFDDYRLPLHDAASFRYLLCKHFFFPMAPHYDADKVHFLQADAPNPERTCADYGDLILAHGPDLQLKGIGENGHWGFHEPGMPLDVEPGFHRVKLSRENLTQQMRDHPALFPSPKDVPSEAFTANVPLFMRTRVLIEDNVPQQSKAFALLAAYGSDTIDPAVPSSALKRHPHAIVRATIASAWALRQYREKGVVSSPMLDQLAASVSQGGIAKPKHIRSSMRDVLKAMNIAVA